jgi:hypothetical protein
MKLGRLFIADTISRQQYHSSANHRSKFRRRVGSLVALISCQVNGEMANCKKSALARVENPS